MNEKQDAFTFYDAVSVRQLDRFGYANLSSGRFSDRHSPLFNFYYNDGGRFGVIISDRIIWLAVGECIFVSPSLKYRLVLEGEEAKVFYAEFAAEETFAAVPSDSPMTLSVFGKSLLSTLNACVKTVYGEAAVGERVSAEEFQTKTDPKPLADAGATVLQTVGNCIELLIIDCIKPAYKPFKASFEEDNYAFESEKLADRINSYLAANVNKQITLEELSQATFFSVSYLKTAFKKRTGKSIMRAHAEIRIKEAEKMLLSGISAKETAQRLRFSSQNHFSSTFKKITGKSPSAYKKSIADDII